MTVYIDDMRRQAKVGNVRANARWSHLTADTHNELIEFAKKLGLNLAWIQKAGTKLEHFDVTDTVRNKAIKLGATQVTYPGGMAELLRVKEYK